jgi:protein-S-isoprenylcysteine O-methyltransferase Ste14
MNGFNRIFGSGPVGLFISVALFLLANFLKRMLNIPEIFVDHETIRVSVFISLTVICIMVVGWSFKSLDPRLRGKTLTTTGAFRYFRHPLYAAFVTFFDFGLAILLNNWAFVCWAFLLHPIWHFLVRKEENMLREVFPNDYEEYCKITGRFFPRLIMKKR